MSKETVKLEAHTIKHDVKDEFEGKLPKSKNVKSKAGYTKEQYVKSIASDIKEDIETLDALRTPTMNRVAVDVSLGQFMAEKYGFSTDDKGQATSFLEALGIDLGNHSIDSLLSEKDFDKDFQWLVPEVIRDAIRLGLRRAPIWPQLIASEEAVSQKEVTMPHINMSAANPKYTDEAETIEMGDVSFGQRKVNIKKITTGISMPDEVIQYVRLNLLSLYLQDVGVKMDNKMSGLAVETLINGDNSLVNMSAPVVGVRSTTDKLQRVDLLKVWTRMSRLGRLPQVMLSAEDMFIHIMELPEFKGFNGETTKENMRVQTPLPNTQDMYIHGTMQSEDQLLLVDRNSALVKLNAQPMRVENERIVRRQISGTVVSVTTGFANIMRDGRCLIDQSLEFASNGFPAYMDVDAEELDTFEY